MTFLSQHFRQGGLPGVFAGMALALTSVWRRIAHRSRRSGVEAVRGIDVERTLGSTLGSIGAGFIAVDRAGFVTHVNAPAEEITGWHEAEARGRAVGEIFIRVDAPTDASRSNPVDLLVERGPDISTVHHVTVLSRWGHRNAVETRSDLLFNAEGEVRGMMMILRDASRLAAIVESSNDAIIGSDLDGRITTWNEAALRASEARLRFSMEAARIGEWEIDLKTQATRHSLLHARCFGYDQIVPDWSVGAFLAHVHPEDRRAVQSALALDVDHREDINFQCRVVWADGSIHWIQVHGSELRDDGERIRMVGIISDITEQKVAEESWHKTLRLEAENLQIQESNRMKSLFLATMSHELRTPLNAIIGFADLLYSGAVGVDSPKHVEFLGYIATSGRHLLQLINDVLDLSKVEAGKLEFYPEPIVLATLVKEVKAVLHTASQQKSVTVDIDLDPSITDLLLDPHRLRQVLYNYLSNAIKFSHEGGHVIIRVRPEGVTHVRIEVQDDGVGIAAADIPKLFSEFQQLDPGFNRQHAGTGLGLALTRRLVEAQGGYVGVRSVLGRGSTFFFTLNRIHGTDSQRHSLSTRTVA